MHNTKCTCSTETLGIHTCIRVQVPRKEFAINLLPSWSAARMHMQHRDTWNPHLYSGTGTSQRVCHQPASKLECRTNVNELSTSGSIPRCLLTKMPHAVPFHGGVFVCILYKDTVGGWQWPGSRNRLLSEPFALGTELCSVACVGERAARSPRRVWMARNKLSARCCCARSPSQCVPPSLGADNFQRNPRKSRSRCYRSDRDF